MKTSVACSFHHIVTVVIVGCVILNTVNGRAINPKKKQNDADMKNVIPNPPVDETKHGNDNMEKPQLKKQEPGDKTEEVPEKKQPTEDKKEEVLDKMRPKEEKKEIVGAPPVIKKKGTNKNTLRKQEKMARKKTKQDALKKEDEENLKNVDSDEDVDRREDPENMEEPKPDTENAESHDVDNKNDAKETPSISKKLRNKHKNGTAKHGKRREKKKLTAKDFRLPDHLDAVKMEQDGHLNRDYRKEIFLGNHEEFERANKEELSRKLGDIFQKVDTDKNSYISQEELEDWIILKVQEHFDEAVEENERVFSALDTDGDGFIDWKEFYVQFLVAHGFPQGKAESHVSDYEAIPLEGEVKDHLVRYKFRWNEADESPQDNRLTMMEFRAFRHPEQSARTIDGMVSDIMEGLDRDGDKILTEEEFAALPPGEVEGPEEYKKLDEVWQKERRKEFQEVIDKNKDGKVTKEELKAYVDPRNPSHARMEARNLISMGDTNQDGQLSIKEVIENKDLFLGSKMCDTGKSFHDEF